MKVFRYTQNNLIWGERILLIAADDIDACEQFLPNTIHSRVPAVYDREEIKGLTYDGGVGIIEHFYWEE